VARRVALVTGKNSHAVNTTGFDVCIVKWAKIEDAKLLSTCRAFATNARVNAACSSTLSGCTFPKQEIKISSLKRKASKLPTKTMPLIPSISSLNANFIVKMDSAHILTTRTAKSRKTNGPNSLFISDANFAKDSTSSRAVRRTFSTVGLLPTPSSNFPEISNCWLTANSFSFGISWKKWKSILCGSYEIIF